MCPRGGRGHHDITHVSTCPLPSFRLAVGTGLIMESELAFETNCMREPTRDKRCKRGQIHERRRLEVGPDAGLTQCQARGGESKRAASRLGPRACLGEARRWSRSRVGAGQGRARRRRTSPTERMWGSLLGAMLLAVAACDRQALALSTHRQTTCVSGSRAAAIVRPTSSDEHGESQQLEGP